MTAEQRVPTLKAENGGRSVLGGPLVHARELNERVRSLVDQHLRQHRLSSKTTDWYRLLVSMDNIGNTLTAIEGFRKAPYPSDQGARYVLLLGLMNAMIVQQDSVQAIVKVCGNGNAPLTGELAQLRDTRNDLVHPFREKKEKGKPSEPIAAVFISAMNVERETFHLYRAEFAKGGTVSRRDFPIIRTLPLVMMQLEWTCMHLQAAVDAMELEDSQHRAKFSGRALTSIIAKDAMQYCLSKIAAALDGQDVDCGTACLEEVRVAVQRIREDLEERGEIPASEWAKALVERIESPLGRIHDFLTRNPARPIHEIGDAKLMCEHIRWYLDDFFDGLADIDEKYAQN